MPLVTYSSPMYSQTFSEVQINELGLDKWRLNTDGHVRLPYSLDVVRNVYGIPRRRGGGAIFYLAVDSV